jgi:hypothetical protein
MLLSIVEPVYIPYMLIVMVVRPPFPFSDQRNYRYRTQIKETETRDFSNRHNRPIRGDGMPPRMTRFLSMNLALGLSKFLPSHNI